MNLWARLDSEDSDIVHFSAKPYQNATRRRLIASIHVDDLELLIGGECANDLFDKLKISSLVFVSFDLRIGDSE